MKLESLRTSRGYWTLGILAAAAGIILTRVIAPQFAPKTAAIAKVSGQVIAIAGLVIIAVGIKRRRRGAADDDSTPAS